MNILYLSDTGSVIGGGEISLLAKFENIDRSRCAPYFAVVEEGDLTEAAKGLNVPTYIIPYKRASNPLNIFSTFKIIRNIKNIISKDNIHIVHTNSSGGFAFLGAIAAKAMGKPFIWHVRTNIPEPFYDWLMGLISTKIIIISEATRKRLIYTVAENKMRLIYNGLNLDEFYKLDGAPFRKEIGCSDGDILVGSVGRYHPIKGYKYFIQAARLVKIKYPKARFCIVGLRQEEDVKHFNNLKLLAEKLGLKNNIAFLCNRKDITRIMSAFDVFVIPSLSEPFGRVIIEAMSCEKPVVGFNSGGVPEIVVDGQTGFLIPPYSTKIMAEKIIVLLNDKNLRDRLGIQGRARMKELFDIQADMDKVMKLYLELLPGGSS